MDALHSVVEFVKKPGSYVITELLLVVFILFVSVVYFLLRNNRLFKSVTTNQRGTASERNMVVNLLKSGFQPENIFHDLLVHKGNDYFSQIDLVVLTDEGILVIEVKDYSGWIYGSGYAAQWTKVLAKGRKKYRFQNPIKQNHSHILALKSIIPDSHLIPFYSIIVFYGDCRLKDIDFVPKDTYIVKSSRILQVLKQIRKNGVPVKYWDKSEVISKLSNAVIDGGSKINRKQHEKNIRDLLGKDRIFR